MDSNGFEKMVDRKDTDSLKWDYMHWFYGEKDLVPLWVADMDFPVLESMTDAIVKRARHGIYGYTVRPREYYRVLVDWQKKRNDWEIKEDWVIYVPGVVGAINIAILLYSEPGDEVVIQTPVYAPFRESVTVHGRVLVENELQYSEGGYSIDFEALEQSVSEKTKILLFCSPHNPVGRVWRKEELIRLGDICREHDLLLISDEIHSDLIMPGHRHTCIASLTKDLQDRTITLNSIGKTFNAAGLMTANAIIPNEAIRNKMNSFIQSGFGISNLFGIEAHIAAYRDGEEWLKGVCQKIKENYDLVRTYFETNLPDVRVLPLEGTYLVWLDMRKIISDEQKLERILVDELKLAVEMGSTFGPPGRGFIRLNVATQTERLEGALRKFDYFRCRTLADQPS